MSSASFTLLWFGAALFSFKRIPQYLRFLQQEEYSVRRFMSWVLDSSFYDRKGTLVCLLGFLILHFIPSDHFEMPVSFLAAIALIAIVQREPDPCKVGKITLKMTERAQRIERISLFFTLLIQSVLLGFCFAFLPTKGLEYSFVLLAVSIQALPLIISFSVICLKPGERAIQNKFLRQAKKKYSSVNPFTIGITGSYGKTSTKAMLGRIMESAVGPTFWPQKGINTPMGITREIREKLSDTQKHAVIEMGAYRPGSIKRLCGLTPPHAGIITAVGIMHLERMGGVEGVLRAKSELAQAIPEDGILVCNADNEGALEIARRYPKKTTLLYGLHNEEAKLDAQLRVLSVGVTGTNFEIDWNNKFFKGFVKLHGEPALSNLLASFTMACALGANPENVLAAARNIEPVDNRLHVKAEGASVQINDAYNSNPIGFRAALDVLEQLEGQRKILLTPGMVDLGDLQEEENTRVAERAAEVCHLVYVIGEVNRKSLLKGLSQKGFPEEQIKVFDGRDAALIDLAGIRTNGDVVLLENDLPDLFELDVRL